MLEFWILESQGNPKRKPLFYLFIYFCILDGHNKLRLEESSENISKNL